MDYNEESSILPVDVTAECDVVDVKLNENDEEDEEDDGINSAMSCETADMDELDPIVRGRSNTWACSLQGGGIETQESGIMVGETPGSSRESLVTLKKASSGRRNAWGSKSYADIITQAIEASPERRLTLAQIYDWMTTNIPYFSDRSDGILSGGWKNSIRHNLSLHDRFKRLPNEAGGKSSYWVNNYDAIHKKASRHRAFTLDTKQYEKKRTMARNRLKAQQVCADLSRGGASDSDDSSRYLGFTLGDGSNASSLHRLSPIEPITEGDEQLPMSSFHASASATSVFDGGATSPLVRWGEDITDQDDDEGYLLPPYPSWDTLGLLGGSNSRLIDDNERQVREDVASRCNNMLEGGDCSKRESQSDVKANLVWGGDRVVNDRRNDVFFNDAGTGGYSIDCGSVERPNGSSNTGASAQAEFAQQRVPPQQSDQLSDLLQMLLLKQRQQQQASCGGDSVTLSTHQQLQLKEEESLHHGQLLQQQSLLSAQHTMGQQLRAKMHDASSSSSASQQSNVAHASAAHNSNKPPPTQQQAPPMTNADYLKLLKLPEFWMFGNPAMLAKIREILLAKRASTVAAEAVAAAAARKRRESNAAEEEVKQLEQLLQLRTEQELSEMLMDGERLVREDTVAGGTTSSTGNSEQRWTDSEAVTADDVDGVNDTSDLDFDDVRFDDVDQVIRQDLLGYDSSSSVLDFNLDLTMTTQQLLTENDGEKNNK